MAIVDLLSCFSNITSKRKKGILKVDGDKEEGNNDEGTVTNEKDEEPWVVVAPEEVKQKKKADDLWASFLSDVGTRPKPSASPEEASSTEQVFHNLRLLDCVEADKTKHRWLSEVSLGWHHACLITSLWYTVSLK